MGNLSVAVANDLPSFQEKRASSKFFAQSHGLDDREAGKAALPTSLLVYQFSMRLNYRHPCRAKATA
jgi:hypothetical protein